ncbi:MAG: hypothetical protein JXQ73_10780 [Phycisphaerae bacterium]|nr:hypothetical protein [Phycisphaerae bacterium]
MIIVGIDEAGYGPLLGPLVVSASVFQVPDDRADESLWEILRDSVAAEVRKRDPRLAVADSKKLHKGPAGLANLERAALASLMVSGDQPATLQDLLNRLSPGAADAARDYPWYAGLDMPLPLECEVTELAMHANALRRNLTTQKCELLGVLCEPLPEGHYNEMVGKIRNKSVVLLMLTLRLIMRVARAHRDCPIRFYVDRQGGRSRYGRWLMTGFEHRQMKIVEESDDRSAYELTEGDSRWSVEFAKRGEDRQLPIALASIFSKYVREAFMTLFNAYWRQRVPDLKPTAGYYTDGKRFLADVEAHLQQASIDPLRLVRQL